MGKWKAWEGARWKGENIWKHSTSCHSHFLSFLSLPIMPHPLLATPLSPSSNPPAPGLLWRSFGVVKYLLLRPFILTAIITGYTVTISRVGVSSSVQMLSSDMESLGLTSLSCCGEYTYTVGARMSGMTELPLISSTATFRTQPNLTGKRLCHGSVFLWQL